MNHLFNSKLPHVGTTIFTLMTQLAKEEGAFNLSQGFPDFPISHELIELVSKYMKQGFNQYAPMAGVEKLRIKVSEKFQIMHQAIFDPITEITITAGATQALYTAITAVVKRGEEVIIFEPAFDTYGPAVDLNGGIPVYVSLSPPDYAINWDVVREKISPRTRMIILNTPHNPTGQVWSREDMLTLQSIVEDTGIYILSDEVYDNLIFDGLTHYSPCAFEQLKKRSFIIGSFGKMLNVTGWKTGYCLAPQALMHEFRKAHQQIVFACNHPMQMAMAEYMENPDNYLQLKDFYMQKRDHFVHLIKNSRFKLLPSYGTYFLLLDYSAISTLPEEEFVVNLTKTNKVAGIPVSAFYHKHSNYNVLRLCFAKTNETLEKVASILCTV